MEKGTWDTINIAAWTFFVVCCAIVIAGNAYGHSDGNMTYPSNCCGGQDCAPASDIQKVEGKEIVFSKFGMHVVPPEMIKQPSGDHRTHVCINLSNDTMRCIFVPLTAKAPDNGKLVAHLRRDERHHNH